MSNRDGYKGRILPAGGLAVFVQIRLSVRAHQNNGIFSDQSISSYQSFFSIDFLLW
jgi:hypothetical protein